MVGIQDLPAIDEKSYSSVLYLEAHLNPELMLF